MQPQILRYHVEHIVQPGETLCSIAIRYYGDESRWQNIYDTTKLLLRVNDTTKTLPRGDFDPTNLPVGMVVYVPYPTQGIQED